MTAPSTKARPARWREGAAHAPLADYEFLPAPSWHLQYSREVYPRPEGFLQAIVDYLRTEVVAKIIALGGDYIQLYAPNYAQWHVYPENRAAFEAWGHDMAVRSASSTSGRIPS